MYSTGAAILLGWGTVYGYTAIYSLALWAHRPTHRTYRTFGLMSLATMVQCIGGALLVDAPDLAAGQNAMGVQAAGAAFTLAFLHHAMVQLAEADRRWLVAACYGWATAVALLGLSGVAFLPGVPAPAPTWGFAAAPDYLDPALSMTGRSLSLLAWPFAASTIHAMHRAARRDPAVRLLAWAVVAMTVATAHDQLILTASLRSYYAGPHATLLTLAAMGQPDPPLRRDQRNPRPPHAGAVDHLRHPSQYRSSPREREQLATVGQLSGLIADQVEEPLEAIRATGRGLAGEGVSNEDRSALLDGLDAEVDGLNRLVDNLLSYARPLTAQIRPVANVRADC